MKLLLTRTHPEIVRLRRLHGDDLGRLVVPAQDSSVEATAEAGIPWAVDNGAFGKWDEAAFVKLVDRIGGLPGCRFVAVPDVVGDSQATRERYDLWRPRLNGLPLALVAQDGLTLDAVPWDELEALFIGGTTDWKLGDEAKALIVAGRARGLWVHVGRVNSIRRARIFRAAGVSSVDGTKYGRFPDTYETQIATLLADRQMALA